MARETVQSMRPRPASAVRRSDKFSGGWSGAISVSRQGLAVAAN